MTFRNAITGAFATIGVAKLANTFRMVTAEIGQLETLAVRVGASASFLSEFGYAARRSGSDVEDFADGFKELSVKMTDAAAGNVSAADAFDRLGLSFSKLAETNPASRINAVADAFRRLNEVEKIDVAEVLFGGDAGIRLIPLLEKGSEGIRHLVEEGKGLGQIYGDEQVADMKKFNVQLDKMSGLAGGFKRNFVINVTPAATEAVEGLTLLLGKVGGSLPDERNPFAQKGIQNRRAAERARVGHINKRRATYEPLLYPGDALRHYVGYGTGLTGGGIRRLGSRRRQAEHGSSWGLSGAINRMFMGGGVGMSAPGARSWEVRPRQYTADQQREQRRVNSRQATMAGLPWSTPAFSMMDPFSGSWNGQGSRRSITRTNNASDGVMLRDDGGAGKDIKRTADNLDGLPAILRETQKTLDSFNTNIREEIQVIR